MRQLLAFCIFTMCMALPNIIDNYYKKTKSKRMIQLNHPFFIDTMWLYHLLMSSIFKIGFTAFTRMASSTKISGVSFFKQS